MPYGMAIHRNEYSGETPLHFVSKVGDLFVVTKIVPDVMDAYGGQCVYVEIRRADEVQGYGQLTTSAQFWEE